MTAFRGCLTLRGRQGSIRTTPPRGLAAAAAALILLLTFCAMQAAAAEPGPVLAEAEGEQHDAIEPPIVPIEEPLPPLAVAQPEKAPKPAKLWSLAASPIVALLLAGVLAHYAFTRRKESWRDDAAAAYEKLVNVLAGAFERGKPKEEEKGEAEEEEEQPREPVAPEKPVPPLISVRKPKAPKAPPRRVKEPEVQVVKPKEGKRPVGVNMRNKEAVLGAMACKFDERELPLEPEKADAASIQEVVKDMLLAKEGEVEFTAGGVEIRAIAAIDTDESVEEGPGYNAAWKTLISALEKSTEQIEEKLEAVLETGTAQELALGGPWSPNPPSLIFDFNPAPVAKRRFRHHPSPAEFATKILVDNLAAWLQETEENAASFFFNDLEVTVTYWEKDPADSSLRGEMADSIGEDLGIVRNLCQTVLHGSSSAEAAIVLDAPHSDDEKHGGVSGIPAARLKLKAYRIAAKSEPVSEEAKNAILAVSEWLPLTESRRSTFSTDTCFGAGQRSNWFNREENRTDEELKTMTDRLLLELGAKSRLIDEALTEASVSSLPSYVLLYLSEKPEAGAVLAFELL